MVSEGLQTVLKLEGKLLEPWIEELCRAWANAEGRGGHVELDLTDVSYVDAAGRNILCGLVQRGALLSGCSAFVAELLRESQP
jgi:ABC-type transporter Mla MlaB component